MAIGISPLVDFAFKLMLGSPQHSGVTIHFLNSILVDRPKITHVEIQNPFLGKESEDDKLSILDILVTAENVYNALSAERWAYFLQNADKLTPDEIPRMFPDVEMAEAAGVLEMISQTPEQLLFYNARLKFQRDEEGRLALARQEGEAKGRQKGEEIGEARGLKLGRITLLQELLGIRPSTVEEFAGYDEAELNDIAEQLQHQIRSRGW